MNDRSSGRWTSQTIFLLLLIFVGVFLLSRRNVLSNSLSYGTLALFKCNNTMMTETEIASYRGISLETLHLLQTQRGLTNEAICILPPDKLTRAVDKATHPKPDRPDDALAFRLLQLRDENGFIPPNGLARAAEHIESMQNAAPKMDPLGAAGISPGSWTWLGPGNIGGRIRSILIHPTNTNQMWAGSVSGGIWKTTNGGSSWQPVDDFMANLAVSTLAMLPGNPNTLYAGTGEGFYNGDGIQGAGVFKSTDGGTTWAQLVSTSNSDWYYVNRLAISPSGSVILAATGSGIWRSTNGGSSWTQPLADWRVKDINFHPTNNSNAIASGSEGTAWYSNDGGGTWIPASGLPALEFLGRVEVAYAPSNPARVYASVSQNSGEIWRSTNGGQTYSLMSTGYNYLGNQGWYDNIIWVDPTNADTIIVGGLDLWRSTNGGSSLTQISQWWNAPNSAHADNHAIVEHPGFNGSTNTTVFFGNDGGIYRASNVYTVVDTTGWQELNNNLGITQFYGAAGNTASGIIIGGTQDNGTLRFSGNAEGWTTMFGGDGGFNASDPTNSNYFYGEYVNLQIHRSTDGGVSSDWIYNGLADAENSCANFIAPFILDPNNPSTMLAGGCRLWRSTNVKAGTPTWTSIKSLAGDNISAIAVAQGNSNIIWVGHNDGSVYKTSNGMAASPGWTRVDNNSPGLPNRFVTRLTIDPNNHNLVYATFGGFSPDNVWRTTDGGATWSDRTGSGVTGLPDAPVRSLVIHPGSSNLIYAGTEVGIFASEDGGSTWSLPHDGPANVSVDELFWMNNTLVAATHGRGLFQVPVNLGNTFTLTVTKNGLGSGTIISSPAGIDCGLDCSEAYPSGTMVILTATPDPGSTFSSWSGDADCSDGQVTMNSSKTCTATFETGSNLLGNPSFEDDDNGDGKPDIWSTNAKFTRSNEVTAVDGNYVGRFRATDNSGATIQQAVPNLTAGSTYNFSGWVNIPATSDAFTFKIQVKWRNASNGAISTKLIQSYTSATGGWNEATASLVAPAGTTNALVQMVVSSLNGTIYVDKFSLGGSGSVPTYTLTVNKTGTGSGSVTSNPTGINCGSDCSENYSSGTPVMITAAADPGSSFTGWNGGGCSGIGTCTVTINANTTVTANFTVSPSPADLIVQSITPAPSTPQVNEAVTFSVVIKNQGSGPAAGFWVDLYVDASLPAGCGGPGQVAQRVDSLAAGTAQTLTLDYAGFTTAGNHSVSAKVDTDCEVIESDDNNNTSSISVSVDDDPDPSLFSDDFETGNLSRWTSCTTDGGDLSVTTAAKFVGSFGMQAVIDDNVLINCTSDHPNAEPRYQASFRFHPNNIPMVSGDTHVIFGGYSGTSTMVLRVQFRKSSGNYQVQAGLFKDGSGWTSTSWQTISGSAYHLIELDWKASSGAGANNGSLLFKVDGAQLPELSGVDNDTRRIDRARLGVVNAIDTGTRGTYYFDEFVSSQGDEVSGTVSVVGASTVDENWNPKTTFAPGDTIQWVLQVQNDTGQDAQIELTYDVRGPNGEQITYWNGILTTGPGLVGWALAGTVQSGLDGMHTLYGSGLYQDTLSNTSSTYTVTTITGDPIFMDGFESGNFSAWTSNTNDGGDLSVTTAAKYAGSQGMQALIDDNTPIFVSDGTPNAEPRYRARFYFNRNTVSMVNGNAHFIFKGFAGTDASPVELLRVEVRRASNTYQLRASLVNDGTAWTHTAWVNLPDGWNSIEVDWRAASGAGANNGGLTLWIGGVQKANITTIDNDTRRIDFVRLGALNGIDPEIQGTYYFDAFESRRQTYIGP